MGDLLGEDMNVISKDKLYRCLDQLLPHKKELFSYLTQRWRSLFHARFDILLCDLTSTYFESDQTGIGTKEKYSCRRTWLCSQNTGDNLKTRARKTNMRQNK